jgi:hypothetical protein
VGTPFNATVLATETYTYGGRQGRVSSRTTQMTYNNTPSESFSQSWSWNELGDLASISYPLCQFAACVPVSRSISPGYTNGFLTSVPGWASLSYHANGMVNQVTHTNGVVDTQANDPDGMRRPASISSTKLTTPLWSSGAYVYDGSGNVVKTGNGYFLYDRASRLIEGHVYDGPTGNGTQKWQGYSYDPFGNILSISGTSGRTTPTNAATNRLNGTGTTYDSAGNLTAWNGNTYQYDGFNQMTRMKSGAEDWIYIYTAGDERGPTGSEEEAPSGRYGTSTARSCGSMKPTSTGPPTETTSTGARSSWPPRIRPKETGTSTSTTSEARA